MVLNGKEWRDWRRQAASEAIPGGASASGIRLTLFKEANASYTVRVSGAKPGEHLVVKFAELGLGIESKITGGENAGKTLEHNFVVLNWDSKLLTGQSGEENFKLTSSSVQAKQRALAAWVEDEGNPTPLQAIGARLN